MIEKIINYFDEIIPNPKCELNYNKDYELVIAVMLSAQTTDKKVNMVTEILFKKYPDLESLSEANTNDLIKIIKPIGTYNKKACNIKNIAKELIKYDKVPNDRIFLESLDGVGRKTTNVVLSNLFNENVIAVDTHVMRVSKRLGLTKKNTPLEIEKDLNKKFNNYDLKRIHHQMVLFGRYFCKAQKPLCDSCKLRDICKKQ